MELAAINLPATYLITYVCISIGMTVWVGQTLHKNGRIFLIDAFNDNESKADAINHLLKVGFYLLNFGFILLFLHKGDRPDDVTSFIELLATKIGIVLMILGGMHFFNMYNLNKIRRKGKLAALRQQYSQSISKGQPAPTAPPPPPLLPKI